MRRRVAEPGYEGVERVERVDGYEDRDSVVEERSHFDPAAVIAFVGGFILTIFGVVAMLRGDFDGFPDQWVTVAGMTVSMLVGVIATVVGLGLLLSGASGYRGRSGALFFSALMLIAGFVIVIASSDLPSSLAAEDVFGWLLVLLGALVLAASALLPARTTSRRYATRTVRT